MKQKKKLALKKLEKINAARKLRGQLPLKDISELEGDVFIAPENTVLPTEGEIPESATLVGQEPTEPEERELSIYFMPRCIDDEVDQILPSDAKRLVRRLYLMNTIKLSDIPRYRIIRDNVERGGSYAYLYKGLSPDIQLVEVEFTQAGRIFGFFTGEMFSAVCIKTTHINK